MSVVVMLAVLLGILVVALAVDRSRSKRNSWSDGPRRRSHAAGFLAGGAFLGGSDAGDGGGFDGGGGGGGDGGGGC